MEAVEAVAMHCGLVGLLPGLCATLDTTKAPRSVCATLRVFCGLVEAAGIDDDVTDLPSFRSGPGNFAPARPLGNALGTSLGGDVMPSDSVAVSGRVWCSTAPALAAVQAACSAQS